MSTLPIGARFGSFQIVRHIGGGGMAQIYLAKTSGLAGFEKYLALKVINPDLADDNRFIDMLCDEAKLTVGLNHTNIAQVFDLGKVGNIYFISMEFVDGIDVLELVNGLHALGEKVPVVAAAYIAKEICAGLHYAHTRTDPAGNLQNIVHRDISPQNILVSRAGEVKVVDFGIAKAAGMNAKTQAGVIKGKVHYMAPEQAHGEAADCRADIFSSGIVLWEMLTSQMVYSGDNVRELVDKVRRADIRPPSTVRSDVPSSLDAIVARALARSKEQRYQTAYEFQVALTKFLSAAAGDFSSSHLSQIVDRVLARKKKPKEQFDLHVSADDMGRSEHSVIAVRPRPPGMDGGPVDRPRLVVETDQGKMVQELTDELLIGRAGQLTIADARVSRRHAVVRCKGSLFELEDLGSSNGTYLNGQRISGTVQLVDDDTIRVGSCHIRFQCPGGGASPSGTAGQPPPLPAEPKLVVRAGSETWEHTLSSEVPLEYQVQVGGVLLRGQVGRVLRKGDDTWLEPAGGRRALLVKGRPATDPVRLNPGDTFGLGEFTFEFVE